MKKQNQPDREFAYSGKLSENPLPNLLYTVSQYKVPGMLACCHNRTVKQIYIREGRIVFAESTAQEDHLGEFLFRCGKIKREQLDRSIAMLLKTKGSRLGQILVELKALPQQELSWAVKSHQQAIVWSLFNWFDGDIRFRLGEFKRDEKILLDLLIPRTILDGVRNIHNAKRIITYIGNRSTILELEPNSPFIIEVLSLADEKERDILRRVDGKSCLYDICAGAPYGAHETAKILYGLLVLKLLRRRQEGIRMQSRISGSPF